MIKTRIFISGLILVAVAFFAARAFYHTSKHVAPLNTRGYVSRVIDGDTIQLSNGEKLRYIGIDTPEIRERVGTQWIYNPRPYAEEAREFNAQLVEGKYVRLEYDVQKRDKYRRILAYVYTDDIMVNLEMVRQGYAMIYTYPPNVKYVERFIEAQRQARENKRGLWSSLDEGIITASEAKKYIGYIKMVKTEIIDTYLSDRVLILHCRDNFKIVIFRDVLTGFGLSAQRSPESYFKYRTVKVYGLIKKYRGATEIVLSNPSQLEIQPYQP